MLHMQGVGKNYFENEESKIDKTAEKTFLITSDNCKNK